MCRMHAVLIPFILAFAKCTSLPGVKYECPPDNAKPCDCSEAYGKVFLTCSSLQNRRQLKEAVSKMAGFGITELLIKDSNVSHIPGDLFKDSPVTRIRVRNTAMFYLFDSELEHSANTLTEITVFGADFEGGLDWSVLDNLKELRTLSVSRSELEKIPYGMSELELPLETLILEEDGIESIYEDSFSNLKELKNLVLKRNFLKEFRRSMLPKPESRLQFFDLSYNMLTSLPEDMFEGMGELHSLLLSGNKFTVLGKTYMEKILSSLFFLDASNNPLKCDCEMSWLLSEHRPFHISGQCVLKEESRNLQDLTSNDFAVC